jgi:SAM-dependent methyltransferase
MPASERPRPGGEAGVDRLNAEFWDELCGTNMARSVGVTDASPASLARFDAAYLDFYPYLEGYLPAEVRGKRVLEIGLGYGTVGQILAARGASYHGLDIAAGPVEMMRHRLSALGIEDAETRVVQGSALEIPHDDASFDHLVSIGCLHHTGDLARAVSEVWRVLRPGGAAVVMVYNRRSLRQLSLRARRAITRGREADIRGAYDANSAGVAAPATEFASKAEASHLFGRFSSVEIRAENFDEPAFLRGRVRLPRRWFLGAPARLAGLDLYVIARK